MVKMQVRAIYEDEVLKPLKKLDLPDKAEVKIIIKESFSRLLEEVGEAEAKEDVDQVLKEMRAGITMNRAVLDTSVIVKGALTPSKSLPKEIYFRELDTHQKCRLILKSLDENCVEVFLPKVCVIETAAVDWS